MGSDRVMVMDAGRVVEFGHPYDLLRGLGDGYLRRLVDQMGAENAAMLGRLAEETEHECNDHLSEING